MKKAEGNEFEIELTETSQNEEGYIGNTVRVCQES